MLLENGEFDINSTFTYDRDWADELFFELLANNKRILETAKANGLEEEFYKAQNIFKDRANLYDPYANQEDDEVKTNKYYATYDSMYDYVPLKNLWGQEKPFVFSEAFDKVAATFGTKRNYVDKVIIAPYFVPLASDKIGMALTNLDNKIEFEWNDDNPLVLISKIVPYLTAVQPLLDGNHRASHAMLQYYLGKAELPAILRNKHLQEHYEAYTNFEKEAITTGSIDDLIAYYYYNILERQTQICKELGFNPDNVLTSKLKSIPDKEIV